MNPLLKRSLVLLILLILAAWQVQQAEAAKGIPGSPEFGFGVVIYPDGPMVGEALNLLGDLHPDWLYVPLAWSASQASAGEPPDLSVIDQVMAAAAANKVAVVIGLTQAPAWAMTEDGPDAHHTAQFVSLLARRYPGALQALELFPRANSLAGWGSAPNPQAYLGLFRAVKDRLSADGAPLVLVAAGLQPAGKPAGQLDPAVEVDDLAFLQGLYDAGAKDCVRVFSMQFADVRADLLTSPYDDKPLIFRQYETVRAAMLANQHSAGVLWITSFGLPTGGAEQQAVNNSDLARQQEWLQQGYYQVHSQLYIGMAALQSLNPGAGQPAVAAMLQPDGSLHPFYPSLQRMTLDDNPGNMAPKPGSFKMGSLLKNKP
jgi:hypothetical protein